MGSLNHRWICCFAVLALGCEGNEDHGAALAKLESTHLPTVRATLLKDIESHKAAIAEVAKRLAPGFAVEDPEKRQKQMRAALRWMRHSKKGVPGLIASPASFIAAVQSDGIVLARDKTPDSMQGQDFQKRFAVVAQALKGNPATGMGEFVGPTPKDPTSLSLLFAAPVVDDKGAVIGAVVTGIPLTRWSQRINRQYRIDHIEEVRAAKGIWSFLVAKGRLFHMGAPPEIALIAKGVLKEPKGTYAAGSQAKPIWAHGTDYAALRAPLNLDTANVEVIFVAPVVDR